jgi:hypothetical protein
LNFLRGKVHLEDASKIKKTMKTNIKTIIYQDYIGRSAEKNAVFFSEGKLFLFRGCSIPGVCEVTLLGEKHKGGWDVWRTYKIDIYEDTEFFSWLESWVGGLLTCDSWEEGFKWLKEKIPTLDWVAFKEFIRNEYGNKSEDWDNGGSGDSVFEAFYLPPFKYWV